MLIANADEHDRQTDCSSAAAGKCPSRTHDVTPPPPDGQAKNLRLKYGPIGWQRAAKSLTRLVRLLRVIANHCLSMLANLLCCAQSDETLKPSQPASAACAAEHELAQGLMLPPCKLASLRIALGIVTHVLLDWFRTHLGSLGQQQQQQLELPVWYMHSSMLTACDLIKLALLVVTTCGVCADISRMMSPSAGDPAPGCTASAPPAPSNPTASTACKPPSQEHEEGPAVPGSQRIGNQPCARGPEEEAGASPELCAAEGSCPVYRSRYSRRYRLTVKVPVDLPELPEISTQEVQARLTALSPSLHVQRLGVRSGCIILELDCVDLQHTSPSSPSSSASSAASLLSDAGWLEVLNVHGIASGALAGGEALMVSMLVDDRSTQLCYDPATAAWTQLPDAATGPSSTALLQLRPQCLLLDTQVARVSCVGCGIAADGNRVEAVSGGRPQPCRVVSQSHGAGQQDVVDLALELSSSWPGLVRCNVWSSSPPASCMLATLPLLLLPAGCAEAAAQLTGIAAAGMALELFLDLGELLEASSLPAGRPATTLTADNMHALAESASNLHAWCLAAGHRHVAQLVTSLAARLPDLIGHVSETRQPEAGEKVDAAPAPHAPSGAQPDRPMLVQRAWAWGCRSLRSLWAAVRALDTAPALGRTATTPDQQLTAALPPKMWSLFVMLKFVVACRRSVGSGAGLFEATALAIWTLPYALVFWCHVAWAPRRRAAPAPGAAAAPAAPAAQRSVLVSWLARNSRLLLHIHRTILFLVMAWGYLPVPFVLQLAFKNSLTTYPIKLLYMLMECYAWRAAVPFLLLVDTPVLYVFNAWLGLPRSMVHAGIVNLLAVAIHVGMSLCFTNGPQTKSKKV